MDHCLYYKLTWSLWLWWANKDVTGLLALESTKTDVYDWNVLLPQDRTKISQDFCMTSENF